ncbi:MAG: endonuclease/exonuclease/phosphatase family protein [Planctomycetaceae bacterium]
MKIWTRLKSWNRKRKLLVALAVVLVIAVGPYVVSRLKSSGRRVRIYELSDMKAADVSRNVNSLRVLTFNIAHGRGPIDDNHAEGGDAKRKRIAQIAELIQKSNADVVILNEVDFDSTWSGGQNQAEAIAKQAGYRYRAEQRNIDFRFIYGSWKFGNAVLSRYPIMKTNVIDYPAVAEWESWLAGKKRGLVCTLQLAQTQQVRIVAVHLETRDPLTRFRSAQKLLEVQKRSTIPLILAGDFNSTPPGFPHAEQAPVNEKHKNTIEFLAAEGRFRYSPTKNPGEADFTFSAKTPDRVIDWILIPRDWKFESYCVLKSELSDHRPVLATLQIFD